MGNGPDKIFYQILHRKNPGYLEMKIGKRGICRLKTPGNKVPEHTGLGPEHSQSLIKKFRKNNKIYGNIFSRGRQDFLGGVLV